MTLLEARGVEVRFGGLLALAGVDLDAERGQVTGLIGPNGAGKTTLFNVVSGLIDPSAGAVRLDGCDITAWPAHRRARAGVARTFQRPQLFGRLTVADNLMAGWEASRGWGALGRRRSTEGHHRVSEVIDLLGLAALADRPAAGLPTGQARMVEMGRALVTSPCLLMLDEPGSGLGPEETDHLGSVLRRLVGGGDLGILLVEHDVGLVMDVCDQVRVLESGRVIAAGPPSEVRSDPEVHRAYLGPGEPVDGEPAGASGGRR